MGCVSHARGSRHRQRNVQAANHSSEYMWSASELRLRGTDGARCGLVVGPLPAVRAVGEEALLEYWAFACVAASLPSAESTEALPSWDKFKKR